MTDYSTAIPAEVERSLRDLQYREPLVFRSSMTREQFHDFVLKKKITEGWMANGVRLAWLIDPIKERAWVYRADGPVEEISAFDRVLSGEDVLPGFELDLRALKG